MPVWDWTRRAFIQAGASVAAVSATGAWRLGQHVDADAGNANKPYFRERGYYITFMRSPLFTFETWKEILDGVKEDGGNLIILWMGGAFPSKKFPITWKYNAEHENNRHNFAGKLIDYAHALGISVLLGLTPFSYDGVNQYTLEHPELKAINEKGNYTKLDGLGAWGFNLNPWLPEAQQFMFDYSVEMLEFYPNADGLLLESSDYAIAYCKDCAESYYQKEFAYVRKISEYLWARKPEAVIAIYPHYFSGADVPGMKIKGAKETFDPRWTLFFTPHSAPFDPALMKQARSTLCWNSSPTMGRLEEIRAGAKRAKDAGATGFIPSFEPLNYRVTGPDSGATWLVGQRVSPFGFAWLKPGESPMQQWMLRLLRMAYKMFSSDPELSMEKFREAVSRELLPDCATPAMLNDLLFLEETFFLDRNWDSTAVLASPEYVKGRIELGQLGPTRLRDYRDRRKRVGDIARRYASAPAQCKELTQVASWMDARWNESPYRAILDEHLR
jgi:hypothetical protein